MKKFFIGILIGASLVAFATMFAGCNHHDKKKVVSVTVNKPAAPVAPAPTVPSSTPPAEPPVTEPPVKPCAIIHCRRYCKTFHVHHRWHRGHDDDGDNYCGDEEEED